MSERWHVVAKPGTVLTPIDPAPVARADGGTWQRFTTPHGATFSQTVEPSGRITWLQKVEG